MNLLEKFSKAVSHFADWWVALRMSVAYNDHCLEQLKMDIHDPYRKIAMKTKWTEIQRGLLAYTDKAGLELRLPVAAVHPDRSVIDATHRGSLHEVNSNLGCHFSVSIRGRPKASCRIVRCTYDSREGHI